MKQVRQSRGGERSVERKAFWLAPAGVLAVALSTVALSAALLAGCGTAYHARNAEARVRSMRAPARIVDAKTGETVSLQDAMARLATARVIYVGEEHDKPAHQATFFFIARFLHATDGSVGLGFEAFEHRFQSVLHEWLAGRIDEQTLLERTEYAKRWGRDFGIFRPIFEFARDSKVELLGLNAPREQVHTLAKGGLEAFSESDRIALPELDVADADHRAMVIDALGQHPGLTPETLERIYLAQVLWDESMASVVAGRLSGHEPPKHFIVLAGNMHVRRGLGIPKRAARRGAEPYAIVLPLSPAQVRAELERPVEERAADFFWIP